MPRTAGFASTTDQNGAGALYRTIFPRSCDDPDLAGLFQRLAVTIGFGWLSLLALRMLRSSPER